MLVVSTKKRMSVVPQLTFQNPKNVCYFGTEGDLSTGSVSIVTPQGNKNISAIVNNGAKFGATKMIKETKVAYVLAVGDSRPAIESYLSTGGIEVILKNHFVSPTLIRWAKIFNGVALLEKGGDEEFSEEFWFMFLGFLVALGIAKDFKKEISRKDIQYLVSMCANFHQGLVTDHLYLAWTHLKERLNGPKVYPSRAPGKKGVKGGNKKPRRGNGKKKVETSLTEVKPDLVAEDLPGKPEEPIPLVTSDGEEETTV